MFFIKSIKTKMLALFGAIMVMVCAGLSGLLLINFSSTLTAQTSNSLMELAKQSSQVVESKIQGKINTLDVISHMEEITDESAGIETKVAFLNEEMKRYGYKMMAIADINGNSTSTNGKVSDISDRTYFKKAVTGKDAVSDPLVSKEDKSIVIALAVPIMKGSTVAGVLVALDDGNELSNITDSIKFGKLGSAYMINGNGTTIAHKNRELVISMDNDFESVKKDPSLASLVVLEKKMAAGEIGSGKYEYNGTVKYMGYAPVGSTGWSLAVTAPQSEIFEGLNQIKIASVIILFVSLIIGLILVFLVISSSINPIKLAIADLGFFARGDFTRQVPAKFLKSKDEIGSLARSVNMMQNSIKSMIQDIITEAKHLEKSAQHVKSDMNMLNSEIVDISATTEELSAGMEETAASTQEMNATSAEIEQAIASIASKAQEGSSTAGEISVRAKQLYEGSLVSQKAANIIKSEIDSELRNSIEQSKAVEQINLLTESILQITGQTNLLALNAAIEAARAGEAGKGFAVVSEEIRKLAMDSKNAVTEIQKVTKLVLSCVESLKQNSQKALSFIEETVLKDYQTMVNTGDQYYKDADLIDNLVTDFSATAEQLSASVENMVKAINEITQSNNESAAGTQEIAAKAGDINEKSSAVTDEMEEVKQSTEKLAEIVSRFKI